MRHVSLPHFRPLCLALALATPAPLKAAESPVLTLDDAITLALAQNRDLQNASLELSRAAERVRAARAQRLPAVDVQAMGAQLLTPVNFTFPAGSLGDYPATGPIPGTQTAIETPQHPVAHISASVAQPLSQLYRIGLGVRKGELAREVEGERLRTRRLTVVNDVKRAYYAILETESALTAAEEQVRALDELDQTVTRYVAQETALEADSLDVRARLALARHDATVHANTLLTRKGQLNLLLGRPLDTEFELEAVPQATLEEVDLAAARSRALEHRPELGEARLQVDLADTDRRMKKSEMIPDVSLAVTYVSFFNVDVLPRNLALLGLQLKWEPLDWGRRGREAAEKAWAVEQARNAARNAEDRIRLDVDDRFRKLQEARALVEASRLGREAAREHARVVGQRYAVQAVLLKDALEAQAKLADASHQHEQALLAFWSARADLAAALAEER